MFARDAPERFKVHSLAGMIEGLGRMRPSTILRALHRASSSGVFAVQAATRSQFFWGGSWESSPSLSLCKGRPLSFRYFYKYFRLLLEVLWVILCNNPYLARTIYINMPRSTLLSRGSAHAPSILGADYVISKVPYCPYVMHKMALDFTPHVVRDDISAVLTGRN